MESALYVLGGIACVIGGIAMILDLGGISTEAGEMQHRVQRWLSPAKNRRPPLRWLLGPRRAELGRGHLRYSIVMARLTGVILIAGGVMVIVLEVG